MFGQHKDGVDLQPGNRLVTFVQEAWWSPGPVWKVVETLTLPDFDHRTEKRL